MPTVEEVKNSLRIDHSEDDTLIDQLIGTAAAYIVFAVDSTATEGDFVVYKQFDWAVSLLAQHWYLNRQEASSAYVPVTVQALIQQIRGAHYATNK